MFSHCGASLRCERWFVDAVANHVKFHARPQFHFAVTGASGSLSHSTTVTLVLTTSAPPHSPDFTLAVAPSTQIATVGVSVTYTLTAKAVSGFNGTILFTNGTLPTGMTVVFNPSSITARGLPR